jgi:hypothetical protein
LLLCDAVHPPADPGVAISSRDAARCCTIFSNSSGHYAADTSIANTDTIAFTRNAAGERR